jgi:lysyl-tRNA synthetase class 2
MQNLWRPAANLAAIKERAALFLQIRNYFAEQDVLEVETPLLCQYAATSLHIEPMAVISNVNVQLDNQNNNLSQQEFKKKFLQTSPEYAMKRLLSEFRCSIFQLCKAFRKEEIGSLHNPEFTILEWYRVGFNHHQLMQDVESLLNTILPINNNLKPDSSQIKIPNTKVDCYTTHKISYREIFIKHLNVDPVLANLEDLKNLVIERISLSDQFKYFINTASKQDCQELLFHHYVEPNLSQDNQIWFIYNYPIEQAALAKIVVDQDGIEVAERFEVYINGIEIANGYHELLDAKTQKRRFLKDQKMRKKANKTHLEIDPYLIAALDYGMPICSGVALGVDRLLMLKMQAKSIQEVICFPYNIA